MHVLPRIAGSDPAAGFAIEALAAAIAQGDEEAKARLKAFLEKRGPKVRAAEDDMPDARSDNESHRRDCRRCGRCKLGAGAIVVVERETRRRDPAALAAPLPPYPHKLTERLVHWAKAAPDRVFLAQRDAAAAGAR